MSKTGLKICSLILIVLCALGILAGTDGEISVLAVFVFIGIYAISVLKYLEEK